MIRYYLDSNIYRYLNKDKKQSYNQQLQDLMDELEGKILFCYSEAHLDDLRFSQKEFRDIDLSIMQKYVIDNYFVRDHIKKYTSCYLVDPITAFRDKNYQDRSEYENPLDTFDKLISDAGKDDITGLGSMLSSILKLFLDAPALNYNDILKTVSDNEDAKSLLNKMFPTDKSILTNRDIVQHGFSYGNLLLKNESEFTLLRKFASKYLDNDISFESWGLEFSDKMKNSNLRKSFLEQVDSVLVNDQKEDFYHRFTMAYSFLELFGIKQEKDNKNRLKKFSYGNMYADAAHAYYATYSDYLVTNDKGLQTKAYILYNIFGITTKVLTLEDFINRRNVILFQEEDSYNKFFKTLTYDLEHSLQCSEKNNLSTLDNVKTFIPNHIYYNYFNRFQLVTDKENNRKIILYCKRLQPHANFPMYREIKVVNDKIIKLLGVDDDCLSGYEIVSNDDDNTNDSEIIRSWTFPTLKYELYTSNGYLCLAINVISN